MRYAATILESLCAPILEQAVVDDALVLKACVAHWESIRSADGPT